MDDTARRLQREMNMRGDQGYVICRSYSAGVFAGTLESFDRQERVAILSSARRIWQWHGAASLSELATHGTAKPKQCKFSTVVSRLLVAEVIEIDWCSEEGQKSIEGVPVWSAR